MYIGDIYPTETAVEVFNCLSQTPLFKHSLYVTQWDIIGYIRPTELMKIPKSHHQWITLLIADGITTALQIPPYPRKGILSYALNHDSAHPPFGHIADRYLQQATGKDHNQALLEKLPEIRKEIETMGLQFGDFVKICNGESAYDQIVSSIIGADKLAYVNFDSAAFSSPAYRGPFKFDLGKFGQEDIYKLVNHMFFDEERGIFGIEESGVPHVSSYIEFWSSLYNRIYYKPEHMILADALIMVLHMLCTSQRLDPEKLRYMKEDDVIRLFEGSEIPDVRERWNRTKDNGYKLVVELKDVEPFAQKLSSAQSMIDTTNNMANTLGLSSWEVIVSNSSGTKDTIPPLGVEREDGSVVDIYELNPELRETVRRNLTEHHAIRLGVAREKADKILPAPKEFRRLLEEIMSSV